MLMKSSAYFRAISVVSILHLEFLAELIAINVALNKRGKDCNADDLPKSLFDGKLELAVKMSDNCALTSYIEVHLIEYHTINFVVLYEGKEGNSSHFAIDRGDTFYVKCSEYHGLKPTTEPGLRVNCNPSILLFSLVRIESLDSDAITLAEIEVHTIESGITGIETLFHRGCFKNFSGFRVSAHMPSLQNCQLECSRRTYTFMAVKFNRQCYCGKYQNESELISDMNCSLVCGDGNGYCGGINYYSVYLIAAWLPSYRGCVSNELLDSWSGVNQISENMTIPECIQYCDSYQYAVLQGGSVCSCRDKIPLGFSTENWNKCRTKCNGNHNSYCGGLNHASLYATCMDREHHKLKCSELLKCSGLYDTFGRCEKSCKEGYIGDYCMEKGTGKLAEVSIMEIELTSKNASTLTEANITNEYNMTTELHTGISEKAQNDCAILNPCRKRPRTTCIILNGKFVCNCQLGYSRSKSTGICEDINECYLKPCTAANTRCRNVAGSYICNCKPGFIRLQGDSCLGNKTETILAIKKDDPKSLYVAGGLIILIIVMLYLARCTSVNTEDLITSA